MSLHVIFFGSTSDSVIVLEGLYTFLAMKQLNNGTMCCVVTQPPSPVGRRQVITPTPVEVWAKEHRIPVCSFSNKKDKPWMFERDAEVVNTLSTFKPDLLISACYGQKIPDAIITGAVYGGLNIHPSLLPRWRGGDPVPWAILTGDHQTGVTIVQLSAKFDQGVIYAQEKIPITGNDISDSLRTKLFTIGKDILLKTLPGILSGSIKGIPQRTTDAPYARRLTRDDGFEPWDKIQKALTDAGEAIRIDRKFRALSPWPGVWTLLRQGFGGQAPTEEKRVKILKAHADQEKLILDTVQLEGKNPVSWVQFQKAYL